MILYYRVLQLYYTYLFLIGPKIKATKLPLALCNNFLKLLKELFLSDQIFSSAHFLVVKHMFKHIDVKVKHLKISL